MSLFPIESELIQQECEIRYKMCTLEPEARYIHTGILGLV